MACPPHFLQSRLQNNTSSEAKLRADMPDPIAALGPFRTRSVIMPAFTLATDKLCCMRICPGMSEIGHAWAYVHDLTVQRCTASSSTPMRITTRTQPQDTNFSCRQQQSCNALAAAMPLVHHWLCKPRRIHVQAWQSYGSYQGKTSIQQSIPCCYCRWFKSNPADIGNTTAQAFDVTPRPGVSTAAQMTDNAAKMNMESKANGSLMRIAPLAIFGCYLPTTTLTAMTEQQARLSHPNKVLHLP